jgi:hypothetical protein
MIGEDLETQGGSPLVRPIAPSAPQRDWSCSPRSRSPPRSYASADVASWSSNCLPSRRWPGMGMGRRRPGTSRSWCSSTTTSRPCPTSWGRGVGSSRTSNGSRTCSSPRRCTRRCWRWPAALLNCPSPSCRHLSLVGGLTIGIPAFFLALEPNARRAQPGFLRRAAVFAIPAGVCGRDRDVRGVPARTDRRGRDTRGGADHRHGHAVRARRGRVALALSPLNALR